MPGVWYNDTHCCEKNKLNWIDCPDNIDQYNSKSCLESLHFQERERKRGREWEKKTQQK